MDSVLDFSIDAALFVIVVLLLISSYRVVVGKNQAERLQGLDLTTTLIIGAIVLVGLSLDSTLMIDVGIALAAFSFVATLAIARFISEGRVF